MSKLKSLIIGAGSIGALKPDNLDYPGSQHILTHANACHKHPKVELVGVVDILPDISDRAGRKWSCPNYYSIDKAFKHNNNIDIVIVAVPTNNHFAVMMELLCYDFKLLIAEKPFCDNLDDALHISNRYEEKDIPILVDYIRRFDEGLKKVKTIVKRDNVQSCRITYNRGLYHEACHAIDLCNKLFGDYIDNQILPFGGIKERDKDESLCVQMKYTECSNVLLIPADGRKYSIFDVDIFLDDGRINLSNHGNIIKYYSVHNSNIYGIYNTLSYNSQIDELKYGLSKALYNLHDTAVKIIRKQNIDYDCSALDAIEVHRVLSTLE